MIQLGEFLDAVYGSLIQITDDHWSIIMDVAGYSVVDEEVELISKGDDSFTFPTEVTISHVTPTYDDEYYMICSSDIDVKVYVYYDAEDF